MASYESTSRPIGTHCLCTTHGELTAIDRGASTGTVDTDDWGSIEAEFHYHCEGQTTVEFGHAAFVVGDKVVVTAAIREGVVGTLWNPKITGFVSGPQPCGRPGVHLSGAFISGENGENHEPVNFDCSVIDELFGEFGAREYTIVLAASGIPQFWGWFGDHYTEAVVAAPLLVPDLEAAEWEDLYGVIRADKGSLDGIAITTGCRLELYAGANYATHIISLTGPGVWNTDGWNFTGTTDPDTGLDFSDWPGNCVALHWTAAAQAAMGDPQWLPHTVNGYSWPSGSGTPPIRSLKILDVRA